MTESSSISLFGHEWKLLFSYWGKNLIASLLLDPNNVFIGSYTHCSMLLQRHIDWVCCTCTTFSVGYVPTSASLLQAGASEHIGNIFLL